MMVRRMCNLYRI